MPLRFVEAGSNRYILDLDDIRFAHLFRYEEFDEAAGLMKKGVRLFIRLKNLDYFLMLDTANDEMLERRILGFYDETISYLFRADNIAGGFEQRAGSSGPLH